MKLYESLGVGLLGVGLTLGCGNNSEKQKDMPTIYSDINELVEDDGLNYIYEDKLSTASSREQQLRENFSREQQLRDQGYELFGSYLVNGRIGDIVPKDDSEFDYETVFFNRGFYDNGIMVGFSLEHVVVYRKPEARD